MAQIDTRHRVDPEETAEIEGFLAGAAAVDGHASIDVSAWTDLVEGGRPGLAALVAREPGTDRPVGYAQVARTAGRWTLEYVIDPARRAPGTTVGQDLARAAVGLIAAEGGGPLQLWLESPRREDEAVAAAAGLVSHRSLYQFRRALPVEPEVTERSAPLETRPFRPGRDETAWLRVNNRAFARHPEQGGWDLADVAGRESEPWFDAEGFLLYEENDELLGFCWTKVHADTEPVQGEIYVIGVDPDAGGRGLGRRLVLAGLAHLAGRGITVGMLYCDATNVGAVKLYVDLGFVVDHVNRAYTGTVEPRS